MKSPYQIDPHKQYVYVYVSASVKGLNMEMGYVTFPFTFITDIQTLHILGEDV
jgi:hypothetical protein